MIERPSRRGFVRFLGGSLGTIAVAPFARKPALAAAPSFIAFGDSYTASFHLGVPSWATQIDSSGDARLLVDLALGGATAEGSNSLSTFDGQVDAWIEDHKSNGIPDRTVIYFGYNDVKLTKPLAKAKNQYRQQVDRLINNGVNLSPRKLILCLLHDWSRNPGAPDVRSRVVGWNNHLRSVASARPNCLVVDLFTRFEDVFKHPSKYGFKNVTNPNPALSKTTYLYYNNGHFGKAGQNIIAEEIKQELL